MIFRNAIPADADRCFDIESSAYAGDEAASRDKIKHRIETYADGFLVLEINASVVGFVNGGSTFNVELSDESFKELIGHDPAGDRVVIMSVAVHPEHQGCGYAHLLVSEYVHRMRSLSKRTIELICEQRLIPMYEKHGFKLIGPSTSDHGGLAWFEMTQTLS